MKQNPLPKHCFNHSTPPRTSADKFSTTETTTTKQISHNASYALKKPIKWLKLPVTSPPPPVTTTITATYPLTCAARQPPLWLTWSKSIKVHRVSGRRVWYYDSWIDFSFALWSLSCFALSLSLFVVRYDAADRLSTTTTKEDDDYANIRGAVLLYCLTLICLHLKNHCLTYICFVKQIESSKIRLYWCKWVTFTLQNLIY